MNSCMIHHKSSIRGSLFKHNHNAGKLLLFFFFGWNFWLNSVVVRAAMATIAIFVVLQRNSKHSFVWQCGSDLYANKTIFKSQIQRIWYLPPMNIEFSMDTHTHIEKKRLSNIFCVYIFRKSPVYDQLPFWFAVFAFNQIVWHCFLVHFNDFLLVSVAVCHSCGCIIFFCRLSFIRSFIFIVLFVSKSKSEC